MISKMTVMIVAIIMSNIMTMVMSKAMMMSKAGHSLPNQMPRLSQLFSDRD